MCLVFFLVLAMSPCHATKKDERKDKKDKSEKKEKERKSEQVLLLNISLPIATPKEYLDAFWLDANFYAKFLGKGGEG